MNGKKARQLRKMAQQVAMEQQLPEASYTNKEYTKTMRVPSFNPLAPEDKIIPYTVYTTKLEDCKKALYNQLKRAYKGV